MKKKIKKSGKKIVSEYSEYNDQIYIDQVDRTGELEKYERRLDSLARILGIGGCAAVAIYDGSLLVKENNLDNNPKHDKRRRKHINDCIDYLYAISAGKPFSEEKEYEFFKNFFYEIYVFEEMNAQNAESRRVIADALYGNIGTQENYKLFCSKIGKNEYQESLKKIHRKNANIDQALAFYFRDFSKIKSFIKESQDFKNIFLEKNCNAESSEIEQKVHAEAQLISELINIEEKQLKNNSNKTKIYLGISKRCCSKCELLRKTASNISNSFTFEARGTHGLSHNWTIPSRIRGSFSANSATNESNLSFKLGFALKETFRTTISIKKPRGVEPKGYTSQSSGDESDKSYDEEFGCIEEEIDTLSTYQVVLIRRVEYVY